MPGIARLAGRSLQLVLAAAAIPLAGLAMVQAMLGFWRAHPHGEVPVLLRQDRQIAMARNESLAASRDLFARHTAQVRREARAVLRRSPLDVVAMRQLAMVADFERPGQAPALVLLAERISRRDLATQVYLIDAAAERGAQAEALRHYDRALSAHPVARAALFAPLAQAIADPAVRSAMVRHAARPWFETFVTNADTHGATPGAMVALLNAARDALPRTRYEDMATLLLEKLVGAGRLAEASALAGEVQGNTTNALGSIEFSPATTDRRLGPFAWNLQADELVETVLGGDGEIRASILPARAALAAERVTVFPPGNYEFYQELTYDNVSPRAAVTWELRCGANRAPLWKQRLPASPGRITYRAKLTIPDSCSGQLWKLTVSADETQFPSIVQVGALRLIEGTTQGGAT